MSCTSECEMHDCGDGLVYAAGGEQCDDGNTDDTDNCKNDCTLPCTQTSCLDVDSSSAVMCHEVCDATGEDMQTSCSGCPSIVCGDGNPENPEQCDDGNTTAGDGCNDQCQKEYCGDSIKNNSTEGCDRGLQNGVAGSGCSSECTEESTCQVQCSAGAGSDIGAGSFSLPVTCGITSGAESVGSITLSVSNGSVEPATVFGTQGSVRVTCNANQAEPNITAVAHNSSGAVISGCTQTTQLLCGSGLVSSNSNNDNSI